MAKIEFDTTFDTEDTNDLNLLAGGVCTVRNSLHP